MKNHQEYSDLEKEEAFSGLAHATAELGRAGEELAKSAYELGETLNHFLPWHRRIWNKVKKFFN